tara:strand:+ start:1966 stop:2793 length:828 start_codon:yes stop_codon:yes gene_type:complete
MSAIIVTGGATGIGLAISEHLASQGFDLIIVSRSEERLKSVQARLKKTFSVAVDYAVCHLRDERMVTKVTDELMGNFDVIGLVNNAAANFICPSEKVSSNGFHAIFDTVAVGTFFMTQQIGKHWIESNKQGAIVSISASYGAGAGPYVVPSAMGKAAVESMTRSLAIEWAQKGIRLNAISPGLFPTPGSIKQLLPTPQMLDELKKYIPQGEFGQMESIAALTKFLLVDCGPYLTGEVIKLDGGFYHASGAGPFFDLLRKIDPAVWQQIRKMSAKK